MIKGANAMSTMNYQDLEADYLARHEELVYKCLAAFGLRLVTVAEFFLSFGTAIQDRVHHGLSLDQVAHDYGVPTYECWMALQYARSSEGYKFQSLVENWSWPRIKAGLEPQNLRKGSEHENNIGH
jgi:hypothetical protein